MQTNPEKGVPNPFVAFGRTAGRSWLMQVLATVLAAAFFSAVVYFCWYHRDLPAFVAVAGVIAFALRCIGKMLPIPPRLATWISQERAEQTENEKLLRGTWARLFRNAYWVGPFVFTMDIWEGRPARLNDLLYVIFFGVISIIGYFRCRSIIRAAKERTA